MKLIDFKSYYFLLCLFLIFSSCGQNVSTDVNLDESSATLTQLMKEAIDNSYNHIPGITLSIKSPKIEDGWDGVYGYDSIKKEDSLAVDQPFRIASITKTFVAASILRLHEEDSLSIYDPVSQYISSGTV